jgi:hypothetical protein
MGKRKTTSAEGEGVPRKKHKKNKHKKKGRIREEESSRVVEAGPGVRPLTLKIKLGKKPVESEEDEGAVGSVGDTAGADQTSPEDHEPAEDGAAEGVLLTLVCRRESMCVCACVRVCQKREVKGKRRHGLLPWRKGSWTRQAMFPGDQGLPSQLDRKQCWDLQMSSCWNFHWAGND